MEDLSGKRTGKRSGDLTRRELIGGTGAAVGGAVLLGASPASAMPGEGGPGPGRGYPDSARGRDRGSSEWRSVNGRFVDGRGEVDSAL